MRVSGMSVTPSSRCAVRQVQVKVQVQVHAEMIVTAPYRVDP
jgi:hypothetical protein